MGSSRVTARRAGGLAALVLAAALAAGCGDSDSAGTGGAKRTASTADSTPSPLLADATKVTAADFPAAGGRTLAQISETVTGQSQVGLATSVLERGENRFAFGVLDRQNRFLYGRTAVYIARTQRSPARGPYPAPADTLLTQAPYRSQTAAEGHDDIAAIYAAQVPFERAGKQIALVLTKTSQATVGALTRITVVKDSPIPGVGDRMPPVDTETLADVGGDESKIDTRVPPAPQLHQHSLTDVLGKKPVALLIATPQLCQSRVCGPVVDIELQMRAQFGDRMEFIHQEVYANNSPSEGLRKPLLQLHLETEPWLFVMNRDGTIAARLEGSFGVAAFRRAIDAALR